MQGDPLDMVSYGIGVPFLIKCLKVAYPDVTQPWYADDAGALGTFNIILFYFSLLIYYFRVVDVTPKLLKYL